MVKRGRAGRFVVGAAPPLSGLEGGPAILLVLEVGECMVGLVCLEGLAGGLWRRAGRAIVLRTHRAG